MATPVPIKGEEKEGDFVKEVGPFSTAEEAPIKDESDNDEEPLPPQRSSGHPLGSCVDQGSIWIPYMDLLGYRSTYLPPVNPHTLTPEAAEEEEEEEGWVPLLDREGYPPTFIPPAESDKDDAAMVKKEEEQDEVKEEEQDEVKEEEDYTEWAPQLVNRGRYSLAFSPLMHLGEDEVVVKEEELDSSPVRFYTPNPTHAPSAPTAEQLCISSSSPFRPPSPYIDPFVSPRMTAASTARLPTGLGVRGSVRTGYQGVHGRSTEEDDLWREGVRPSRRRRVYLAEPPNTSHRGATTAEHHHLDDRNAPMEPPSPPRRIMVLSLRPAPCSPSGSVKSEYPSSPPILLLFGGASPEPAPQLPPLSGRDGELSVILFLLFSGPGIECDRISASVDARPTGGMRVRCLAFHIRRMKTSSPGALTPCSALWERCMYATVSTALCTSKHRVRIYEVAVISIHHQKQRKLFGLFPCCLIPALCIRARLIARLVSTSRTRFIAAPDRVAPQYGARQATRGGQCPIMSYCTGSSHETLLQASFTASLRCAARTKPASTCIPQLPPTTPSPPPSSSSVPSSLAMSKHTATTASPSNLEPKHSKRKREERPATMETECTADPRTIFDDPVSEADTQPAVCLSTPSNSANDASRKALDDEPSLPAPAADFTLGSGSPGASVVDTDYESPSSEYGLPQPHGTDAQHPQTCECSGYYYYSSDFSETPSATLDDDDLSSDLPGPLVDPSSGSSELSSLPPLSDEAEDGGDGMPSRSSSELSDLSSEAERLIEAEDVVVLLAASSPAAASLPLPIVPPGTPSVATKRKAMVTYDPGNRILYGVKRQKNRD
ncbi:hypothetical protein DFP73DRAFT_605696 [Morchella snyderi]|nr:hypothetical protein DFP73DRAFT_605696 [Morchella snyderi]